MADMEQQKPRLDDTPLKGSIDAPKQPETVEEKIAFKQALINRLLTEHERYMLREKDVSNDNVIYALKSGYVKAEEVTSEMIKKISDILHDRSSASEDEINRVKDNYQLRLEEKEDGEVEEIIELKTYIKNGKLEKTSPLVEGYFILTRVDTDGNVVLNIDGRPNSWQIEPDKFEKKYDKDNPLENGVIRPKGGIQKFIRIDEDVNLLQSWGSEQLIEKGGVINITDLNDTYGIAKEEFCETYINFEKLQKFIHDNFEDISTGNSEDEFISSLLNEISPESAIELQEYPKVLIALMSDKLPWEERADILRNVERRDDINKGKIS